jgi:homoserine kinase
MVKSVTVRAPCSTANLGPGFDVFGLALDAFYDEVTVTKKPKSFGIKIVSSDDIPLDPKKNTAGIAAKAMMESELRTEGLEISIKKGVPAGYGLGSSAASAAACVVAIEALFSGGVFDVEVIENQIGQFDDLLFYAGQGEKASAGTVHYDNVAAAIVGGFAVVTTVPEMRLCRYDVDEEYEVVLAIPKIKVPKMKTKVSRGVLPKTVKFTDAMKDLQNAIGIVASVGKQSDAGETWHYWFNSVDEESISERARKKMIPGYNKVKKLARAAGADAVTISGAGPTVIALSWNPTKKKLKDVGEAMKKGFKSAKVDCDIVICKPSKGPEIVKVVK